MRVVDAVITGITRDAMGVVHRSSTSVPGHVVLVVGLHVARVARHKVGVGLIYAPTGGRGDVGAVRMGGFGAGTSRRRDDRPNNVHPRARLHRLRRGRDRRHHRTVDVARPRARGRTRGIHLVRMVQVIVTTADAHTMRMARQVDRTRKRHGVRVINAGVAGRMSDVVRVPDTGPTRCADREGASRVEVRRQVAGDERHRPGVGGPPGTGPASTGSARPEVVESLREPTPVVGYVEGRRTITNSVRRSDDGVQRGVGAPGDRCPITGQPATGDRRSREHRDAGRGYGRTRRGTEPLDPPLVGA
jgi:hypothetical protein